MSKQYISKQRVKDFIYGIYCEKEFAQRNNF